jgi:hypothetical protein
MKKSVLTLLLCPFLMFIISIESKAQNVFSGEPIQVVGSFNGYSTTPYNSDYRTSVYRKVSTNVNNPNDGRGQWATTINVQNSGGNVTPINMPGGGGNGFLFISGPSGNRFQNKWVFSGTASGTVGAINGISAFNTGNDMGLNMNNTGRYTFVFNDVGYTADNAKYYVGFTSNNPVTVANGGVTYSGGQPTVAITTSATPSAGENVFIRYRVATNDFTSSTSIVQATGSGTTWTATLPSQTCGATVFYYIYTSTRTLTQINSDSETDRTLATLRYNDNSGSNYSFTVSPIPTAGITNNSATTVLSCSQSSINITATGGATYTWNNGLGAGATKSIITAGTYTVTATGANGCTATASIVVTGIVTPQTDFYLDSDNDGFGSGTPISACTNPNPSLYVTQNGDCDDTKNTVFPGATEICWNNILENCNGTLSQGCAPIEVNMATANNSVLPSFAIAVAALPYSYSGTTSYRFSITNNETAVTLEVMSPTRFVTIPSSIRNNNSSYNITASAVVNGELVPYAGNTITVLSPVIGLVNLSPTSCGVTLANMSSTISSNPGLNATAYTFRARLTSDNGPMPTYRYTNASSSRFTSLNSFVDLLKQYNTSYSIAVQYEYIDVISGLPTLSEYGDECTVTTPTIPLIGLSSPSCGTSVTRLGATISATPGTGALQYEFRIRLTSDTSPMPMYYYTNPNASRFSSLSAFQGITYSYVTQYTISVRYKTLFNGLEIWSDFGPECTITTPVFPVTEVQPTQCGGIANLDDILNIIPYPGFPTYRITLWEQVGENLILVGTIFRDVPNFKLNMFNGTQIDKNYSISISIRINNTFGPDGKSCDISTFPAVLSKIADQPFKAVAYPNPFINDYQLKIKSISTSTVAITVYDLLGRVVETRNLKSNEFENTTFGGNYPSGIYNVIVVQENETQSLRIIKR